MRPANQILFDRRQLLREQLKIDPKIVDRFRCGKCKVRVLVVADSFLFFNDEDFGLSDLVTTLEATSHPSAIIEVSKAHRGNPGAQRLNGADSGFRFTATSLKNIDVVLMMAASRSSTLTSAELKALATFMNNGGGVFATGDHDSLGRGMCGDLIRVRSMRKWFYSSPGPFGEPVAPDGSSVNRHDTNRPGHNADFTFDDQSDDIPQKISPIYRTVRRTRLNEIREPHPLLCCGAGVIDVMPDHPHEGECIVPHERDRTFTYAGSSFEEYPKLSNGRRLLPEVIAESTMLPGAEVLPSKPPIAGGTFGSISAYDGHQVSVGRVTCDATWHHFVNINLTGADSADENNPKSMGFLASPEGEAHFEKIKAYFRNIVLWLAPQTRQNCMRNRSFWNIVRQPDFFEEFDRKDILKGRLDIVEVAQIGQFVKAASRLDASRCQIRSWILDLVIPELPEIIPDFACLFDPCFPPKGPQPDPVPPFFDSELVLDAAVGNLAIAMLKEAAKLEESGSRRTVNDKALDKMVVKSSRKALNMIGKDINASMKLAERFAPALQNLR